MMKFFLAFLFLLSFGSRGCWGCNWVDIGVGTSKTGRIVKGKPEWKVAIYNKCSCPVRGISLWCIDFQSVEPIDPTIFQIKDGYCIVNEGGALSPNASVEFLYAWDIMAALIPRTLDPQGC